MLVEYDGEVRKMSGDFRVWRPTFVVVDLLPRPNYASVQCPEPWTYVGDVRPLDAEAEEFLAFLAATAMLAEPWP